MKEFTFSDLSRRSGDVLDAALVEKDAVAKRGKTKVMMMPINEYERLERMAAGRRERQAFTLADAPEEDINDLMTGFADHRRSGARGMKRAKSIASTISAVTKPTTAKRRGAKSVASVE